MNGTTVNNINHPLYTHYPTLIPVIPGKQVHFENKEEQVVKHYDKLIITIIKVIDIQYITHCTDNQYWLITIYRVGDTLIHMVPSKTLQKQLIKRKDQLNLVKIGVYCVKQSTILTNRVMHYMTTNLINEWMEKHRRLPEEDNKEEKKDDNKDDNRDDMFMCLIQRYFR